MIQIEEVHIEELRGIKNLTLNMGRKAFAIHGPNGSGKSGVVDAIEFGLTGDMTRLSGKGTAGLSVKTHGPHVDARDYPDKALVRLKVYLPGLDKTVTMTRKVKAPNELILQPDDDAARDVLAEVAAHPEITLTRRQIIKFILTEAGNRSKDIQALLRLESIDGTRGSLKTAANRTKSAHTAAATAKESAADALRRNLDLPKLEAEQVLAVINSHRKVLGLEELAELTATTSFTEGVIEDEEGRPKLEKESSLRDLDALSNSVQSPLPKEDPDLRQLRDQLRRLQDEPDLLVALQRTSFVKTGLDFVTDDSCPLCDTEWEAEALRSHLREKVQKSEDAESVETTLKQSAATLRGHVESLRALAQPLAKAAGTLELDTAANALDKWLDDLLTFKTELGTVEGALSVLSRVESDWRKVPDDLGKSIETIRAVLKKLPDRSAASKATAFLAVAQERLKAYREKRRDEKHHETASADARSVYNAYCEASNKVLKDLYEDVQKTFAEWYRAINKDDEGKFTAKLSPSEGKLDLAVDFHERGLFHPGAYHSEGHQDGMGLCLYLALMRQLLGDDFKLAVLDDVVMSVDKQHRKEVCGLLKREFPDTQFVITTHDEAWLYQMRSAKLVDRTSAVNFRSWTIDHGPRVQVAQDAWEEIEKELDDERVPVAALILRRYLEYVAGEVCAAIGASVPFKLDGNYDLGDLLPKAVGRLGELLKKAEKAAESWGDDDALAAVKAARERFDEKKAASNVEQWMVNKAVHYNEWASFERADFESVVSAFKGLVDCFKCSKCGALLEAQPPTGAKKLICECSAVSFTLVGK
jgi:hypothetical protein